MGTLTFLAVAKNYFTMSCMTSGRPPCRPRYKTYIHTYMHAYIHTYIHTYIHAYIHAYIHTYIRMYVCMHACMYVCIYLHMHLHTLKNVSCMCICILYICMHTYCFAYQGSARAPHARAGPATQARPATGRLQEDCGDEPQLRHLGDSSTSPACFGMLT